MPNGFQSTPPARGATTGFSRDKWLTLISIHAPREGGDPLGRYTTSTPQRNFNPRPPRGGRRWTETGGCTISGFQSTPPARGATGLDICALHAALISIHAPREGGDVCSLIVPGDVTGISIHAPREGGDGKQKGKVVDVKISIHAPREGGDSCTAWHDLPPFEFQSTPPARGATTILTTKCQQKFKFQSTPPARGATSSLSIVTSHYMYFNPRPPRGGRRR